MVNGIVSLISLQAAIFSRNIVEWLEMLKNIYYWIFKRDIETEYVGRNGLWCQKIFDFWTFFLSKCMDMYKLVQLLWVSVFSSEK